MTRMIYWVKLSTAPGCIPVPEEVVEISNALIMFYAKTDGVM